MQAFWDYLHQFNIVTVVVRLLLAMLAGAGIGYGRSRKGRSAGLRTYILVSIGAAMSVLIPMYDYAMLTGPWAQIFGETGSKFDIARYAAQVVAGIGFLGAGIIIKATHQQVKGLTTATGLFAAVCLGMAAGAGFYELAIAASIITAVVLNVMSPLEIEFKRRLRNITLSVEYASTDDLAVISETVRGLGAEIFDIDVEPAEPSGDKPPSAIFIMKLSREDHSHSGMMSSIAELPCVRSVRELIS